MFTYKFKLKAGGEGGYVAPNAITSGLIFAENTWYIGQSEYDINNSEELIKVTGEELVALFPGEKIMYIQHINLPEVQKASESYYDRIAALEYLASTDWYVTRLQETGKPVPEEILAERAIARVKCDR